VQTDPRQHFHIVVAFEPHLVMPRASGYGLQIVGIGSQA
jgi:hypothetical protein